ncbi:MAG: COX15/CtaA family protein [Alphaproteobacteria bacterium]|nr:COX15/CtaA family protein [Alphaproteobacteria bacterium]
MNANAISAPSESDRQIAIWLFTVAGFVMLMVLVGGLTRLTDSGLSITEWAPIRGALPPFSHAAWLVEFEKYKQIPEYQLVNLGMSLAEFKFIYWWEWGHRFLGRIVGLVFFIPFVVFLLQKKITRAQLPPLLGLFALGGLQGLIGWYMVASGLTGRVDVSQYRLAMHLGLALIIFASSIWLALNYWRGFEGNRKQTGRFASHSKWAAVIVGAVLAQSLMGALVAGINAGKTYTDWPFMDGDIIPSGLFAMQPFWLNFFENHLTVQFDHRMIAYALTVLIGWHIYRVLQSGMGGAAAVSAKWLGGALALQIILGISALMLAVPISLGAAHQLGAVALLAIAVTHLHILYNQTA